MLTRKECYKEFEFLIMVTLNICELPAPLGFVGLLRMGISALWRVDGDQECPEIALMYLVQNITCSNAMWRFDRVKVLQVASKWIPH